MLAQITDAAPWWRALDCRDSLECRAVAPLLLRQAFDNLV